VCKRYINFLKELMKKKIFRIFNNIENSADFELQLYFLIFREARNFCMATKIYYIHLYLYINRISPFIGDKLSCELFEKAILKEVQTSVTNFKLRWTDV
jgi:hypothetical protein